ncbi:MAG: thermonuclease family protein [Nitrospiria bacterium]
MWAEVNDKKAGYIFFALINLFSLFLAFSPVNAAPSSFIAEIVAVIDGDTIKILKSRQVITVRLDGIDAPDKEQRYAEEAKSFIESIAFGKKVVVNWRGDDQNKMVLAEVILDDGRSLNREVVKAGFAWWYRNHSEDLSLWRLEGQAREKKLGLWLGEGPIPPWEFREGKRSKR